MNTDLMHQWKREVWAKRQTPLVRMKKAGILFDSYPAHTNSTVTGSFKQHYNTTVGVVPGGMTPLLQGIDTHINKSLKTDIKKKYRDFMRNGVVELTRGGNKKGSGYQLLVDWCSEAWAAIDKDLIIRSFVQTGVTNTGVLEVANLHTNLRDLLEGNVEVEVIQQELEEEGSTGLTDNEDSDDDDDVVEDSQVF